MWYSTNVKLPALAHLDASGQSVTMPDLPADLTKPVTLGPAKVAAGTVGTWLAQPSSGSGETIIENEYLDRNFPAREAAAPPAPSPVSDARYHDGTPGGTTTWGKDGRYEVSSTPAADTGTMTWARRGAGTYTYGFRMQGDAPGGKCATNGPSGNWACGGTTPWRGFGSLVFSGTITQKVTLRDGSCTIDSSSILTCLTNSDDHLAKAVAKTLGKSVNDTLTSQDLATINLNLANGQIDDLTHIDLFWQATILNLDNNQISDIKPLKPLATKLTNLHLSHNQINDITTIKDLTGLAELDLGSNNLDNIHLAPLGTGSLTKLNKLWLDHNHITDLTGLGNMDRGSGAKLPDLAYLDASGQSVTMPDLPADLTKPVSLGPAKTKNSSSWTLFAQPSSGSGPTTIWDYDLAPNGNVAARDSSAPPAPSPTRDARYHDGTPGGATNWGTDGRNVVSGTPKADDGTMTWPRRGAGTYTYGFRIQGRPTNQYCNANGFVGTGYRNDVCGGSTPWGGAGTLTFSGTITQKVTLRDGSCTSDSSSILTCLTNSDDHLAKAVAKTLGKSVNDTLTSQDLATTNLNLANGQIDDLTHIDLFWQATTLNLNNNQISDIKPLKPLATKLTNLHLSHNQINDITTIKDLTNLTELDLGSNNLDNTHLAPLGTGSLTKLNKLWLDHNHITDLTGLGNMDRGSGAKLPD
ncbi:hypothetical protein CRD60_07555, partial [Bifidobacterium aemilianum]